jgi:hypothetical protein
VAYSLACTFESDVVSARRYESLRFGSFDHVVIDDELKGLVYGRECDDKAAADVPQGCSTIRAKLLESSLHTACRQ